MTESFYTAEAEVTKVEGVHRRVRLATGTTFDVGVHGRIKQHYRLDAEADRPLPVDYLVGAAGA
jgi:adenosyl cobinamide kinase/adenosyl cobinamide phosphate guanylyltransferase